MMNSPGARCSARRSRWALALAALVLASCGGSVELLSEVPEAEANEVLAVLDTAGLKPEKITGKEGMVKLLIDKGQVAKAVTVLNAEGLPRPHHATMGDVFRKEGLISSPLEERARYLWALSQELSATVAQIDGVIKSRVHVVLPERATGGEAAQPSSAAVFIKHQRGYNLQGSIPQIKQLVSNSIPGLTAEKVTVVLVQAQPKPVPAGASPLGVGEKGADKVANPVANLAAELPMITPHVRAWLLTGAAMALLLALAGGGYFAWRAWKKRSRISATTAITIISADGQESLA